MALVGSLNIFVDGPTNIIDAVPINANFAAILAAVNGNLDITNFNANANGFTVNGGYTPPVFTIAGLPSAKAEHIVRGVAVVPVSTSNAFGNVTVTFTGLAIFTSATSYQTFATLVYNAAGVNPPGWTAVSALSVVQSTNSIIIGVQNANAATNSTGLIYVNFVCIGY